MKKGLSLSLMLAFLATCGSMGAVNAAARDFPDDIRPAAASHRDSVPGVSETQLVKVTDSLFVAQQTEDLWFVAEKVSNENYDPWNVFVVTQQSASVTESSPFFKLRLDGMDPLDKFKRCLTFCEKADVWVIYATNVTPEKTHDKGALSKHVEMSFACLTQKGVPFQLHMGIARNFLYLRNGQKKHEKISTALHTFAAEAMHSIDPKTYIISTPLPALTEIFKKTLEAGTYFEGISRPDDLGQPETPISSQGSVYGEGFSFLLRGPDKSPIFSVARKEAGSQYWWFFSNVQPSAEHPYFVIDVEKFLKKSRTKHIQE